MYLVISGFSFNSVLTGPIVWLPDRGVYEVFGYKEIFQPKQIQSVIQNMVWAIFVNDTFSIFAVFLLCVAFALKSDDQVRSHFAQNYLVALCATGFVMAAATQILIWHAYKHAIPGGDTGGSRQLMPIMYTAIAIGIKYCCGRYAADPYRAGNTATSEGH